MTHELKTLPEYFQRIISGEKTFEARKCDRFFQINDMLILKEYDGTNFTGREHLCTVTYILFGGKYGIEEGYCVMSIKS